MARLPAGGRTDPVHMLMVAIAAMCARKPVAMQETAVEPPALLSTLNTRQREAAEALDGPVLVLAGAGTGKTRVLTVRLARLIETRKAFPGQILAVTFTNKAAREMQDRVAGHLGQSTSGLWIGTFHRIGARMLRRHAEFGGLGQDFTIIDTDDQVRLARDIIRAADIDERRWPPRALAVLVQRWKDKGWSPDRLPPGEAAAFAHGRGARLYRDYQERLEALNAADFGDLLLKPYLIMLDQEDVLEDYHRRFRYILVDEYQDTNAIQYLWLRLLARGSGNICCVGDDDQSIYGWRGAEVGNILKFEDDFPGATVIRLERNYRSTPRILASASALIAHNRGRLGKTLWTPSGEAAGDGDPIQVVGVWNDEEEARAVGAMVEDLQRDGHALNEMAVLVRAGHQTRSFEERFLTIGVPYRIVGGLRFYERREIRDACAYLRLVRQDADDLAFERIINLPRRGMGAKSLQSLHDLARSLGTGLLGASREAVAQNMLPAARRRQLRIFLESIERWRAEASRVPPSDLAAMVLDESGYTDMWQKDKSIHAPGRLENLKELVVALADFETLGEFLDHVSLVMDGEENATDDMVSVMTLHSAKGLEFDTVVLPGWEEGIFPHQRSLEESGSKALEEERRLAYVGLTRARRRVAVLFAACRRLHGRTVFNIPSRFVDELPAEHVARDESPLIGYRDMAAVAGAVERRHRLADRSGPPRIVTQTDHGDSPPGPGARVFHEKFGYGHVRTADGEKLDIAFDKAGDKKVMASFVRRA